MQIVRRVQKRRQATSRNEYIDRFVIGHVGEQGFTIIEIEPLPGRDCARPLVERHLAFALDEEDQLEMVDAVAGRALGRSGQPVGPQLAMDEHEIVDQDTLRIAEKVFRLAVPVQIDIEDDIGPFLPGGKAVGALQSCGAEVRHFDLVVGRHAPAPVGIETVFPRDASSVCATARPIRTIKPRASRNGASKAVPPHVVSLSHDHNLTE